MFKSKIGLCSRNGSLRPEAGLSSNVGVVTIQADLIARLLRKANKGWLM